MNRLFLLLFGMVTFVAHAQVPDYVPTEGLVAWYPFNGNANDESGNGNDGLVDGALLTADRFNQSNSAFYVPPGANVNFGEDPSFAVTAQNTVSIGYWFYAEGGKQPFLAKYLNSEPWDCNFYVGPQFNGDQIVVTADGSNWFSWPIADGWNHTLVIYHGEQSEAELWCNGVSVFSGQLNYNDDTSSQPFLLHSFTYSGEHPNPDGIADDIGFWNRALTEEEILALYNAELPVPGCTDSTACNFDAEATTDDGSCIYPPLVELGEDIATCEASVILDAGEGFTYYEWNTGDTSRSILVQEAGEYSVITSNTVPNEHALQFNGIDASAQFEESILFGVESFSVSVDCRLNAFAGNDSEPYSYIIGHPLTGGTNDHGFKIQTASNAFNGGFQVHINDEGTTHFNVISFDNSVESNVELDQWYDLTMVVDRDNSIFSFYVDGVLVEAQSIHPEFGNLDHPNGLSLGIQSIHQTSLLSGYLDNLQIWDIALSEEQVAQIQTTVPSGNEEVLLGFWDFEEGEGNAANEVNGSASSILLNNAGWTDDGLHSVFDFSCSAEDSIQVSFLVSGCLNPEACNYNALAECEGEACDYTCCPGPGCCSAGMYWDYDLEQCMNYETCQDDLDGDGVIGVNDLMQLLSSFGTDCTPAEEPETTEFTCGNPVSYHGYDYATVQIGEQCWFAENLRYMPFVSPVLLGSEDNGLPHAYVYGYDGFSVSEAAQQLHYITYGTLYNYEAVEEWGVCPMGWSIPNIVDWEQLTSNQSVEDCVSVDWFGNDLTGLGLIPGGDRDGIEGMNSFNNLGSSCLIWIEDGGPSHGGVHNQNWYFYGASETSFGFSVRCIKD